MLSVDKVVELKEFHSNTAPGGTSSMYDSSYMHDSLNGSGWWIRSTIFGGPRGHHPRTTNYHVQSLRQDPKFKPMLDIVQDEFQRMYDEAVAIILKDLENARYMRRVPHTLHNHSYLGVYAPPEDVQAKIAMDLEGRLELLEIARALRDPRMTNLFSASISEAR